MKAPAPKPFPYTTILEFERLNGHRLDQGWIWGVFVVDKPGAYPLQVGPDFPLKREAEAYQRTYNTKHGIVQ